MNASEDRILLGKKIESIRKRIVRDGQMKWRALNKTGRTLVTQGKLVEWEGWKRIVEVPGSAQDYSNVIKGRRSVSSKLADKISACFGVHPDLLESDVPLNEFKSYLDENLRETDRHVPVEETRQLLEISITRKKAAWEAGGQKSRQAESLYDGLIEGYSASPHTAVLECLAQIYLEYGGFLVLTGRPNSAFALYGRLIDNFDNRWALERAEDRRRFFEPVACAMIEKGKLLQGRGCADEAVAALQAAVSRFEDEAEHSLSLRARLREAKEILRDLVPANGPFHEKELNDSSSAAAFETAETDLDHVDFLPLPQQKRLEEFRRRFVNTGQAVLLLGPQIAVRSGLPDESTIWEKLAEAGGLPLKPPGELCADMVRVHGSEWLHRHLAELLDDEAAPLSDIHQIAARIDFRAYLTANPDRLMEWALKDAGRAHRSIFFEPDKSFLPDDKTSLVKFNGSVDHPHTLVPYFDPSRIPVEKYARIFRRLGNVRGLLAIGYRNVEARGFRSFLRRLQDELRVDETLVVSFGENRRESNREDLADTSQCFFVDPGEEKPDYLVRIMGFLGKMSAARLKRLGRRRLFRANPFPGISPYRYRAANFHGREQLVETFVDRMDQLPTVATFFGESGCGKTSFFQAGLVPRLEKQNSRLCLVTRLKGMMEPEIQLAKDISAKAGIPMENTDMRGVVRELARKGKRLFLVIDQFEQFFYPPFNEKQRDLFMKTTLPGLAAEFDALLAIILIVRSDKIEHLHSYKDVPGLDGIFAESRRIESLDRRVAGAMIGTVFESKDYRLDQGCIRHILDDASFSPDRKDKPFLPYLQLLSSRFFEWLEEKHREARGYGETIPVRARDYREFSGKGRLLDEFFREAIIDLLLFEPDRHLVLKIFSLFIEGDRRRLVGKQEIRGNFIDQDKIGLMLLELTRRRLIVFDEARDGYELVHDALVDPLREFLDRQRTDYSRSEFLAIVRRVLSGERIGNQLLENLVLFCLRAGVGPEWLERAVLTDKESTSFYSGLIRRALPEDLPLLWGRLADICERTRLAPDFDARAIVRYATTSKDPRICTAAARMLPCFRLDRDQVRLLRAWIDPDSPHVEQCGIRPTEHPQARGIGKALEAVLTALVLSGEDITDCFAGYGSTILSEAFWWRIYYETLIRFMKSGHLHREKVRKRIEAGLSWGIEDPEQVEAIADVLVRLANIDDTGDTVYQNAISTMRSRRSPAWDLYTLQLCEKILETMPRIVFLFLAPVFPELVRTDRKMEAAYVLGMAAQESQEWLDLLARFMRESDPLQKSFLYQAMVDSPAEIQDLEAANDALTGEDPVDLAHASAVLAIHHTPFVQSFQNIAIAADSPAALLEASEKYPCREKTLSIYALAREYLYSSENWETKLKRVEFLFRTMCLLLARKALARIADRENAILLSSMPENAVPGEFLAWWDRATGTILPLGRGLLEKGEKIQGNFRWIKRLLEDCPEAEKGKLRLLKSRLLEWFAVFIDIRFGIQATPSHAFRYSIGDHPVFVAIQILLQDDSVRQAINDLHRNHNPGNGDFGEICLQDLMEFKELDEAAAVKHGVLLAEELAFWMVDILKNHLSPDHTFFLYAMLNRSRRAGLLNRPERKSRRDIVEAIVWQYKGKEALLTDNLKDRSTDPETRLEVLVSMEKASPGCATGEIVGHLMDLRENAPDLKTEALSALAANRENEAVRELCRKICRTAESDKLTAQAMAILASEPPNPADTMLCVEVALKRPVGDFFHETEDYFRG